MEVLMLLYDRVLEHACRSLAKYGRDRFGDENYATLEALRAAAVYEVSEVVPLFPDWERERDKAVPKRPPHPITWVEWRHTQFAKGGPLYGDDWTLAVLVHGPGEARRVRDTPPPYWGKVDIGETFPEGRELYLVEMFSRLEGYSLPPDANEGVRISRKLTLHEIATTGRFVWAENPDGTDARQNRLPEKYTFFLTMCVPQDRDAERFHRPIFAEAWPAFMAFALLHCRNVVEEEHAPDEHIQRQCVRHGNPPRVTYKTLKIEVPRATHARQAYEPGDDQDTGPRVRFHLCGGHFKHLTHPRYKNPGLHWWPAHYRGSKDLGEVQKTYKLAPRS
jgi:hypothetical protein